MTLKELVKYVYIHERKVSSASFVVFVFFPRIIANICHELILTNCRNYFRWQWDAAFRDAVILAKIANFVKNRKNHRTQKRSETLDADKTGEFFRF